MSFTIAEIARAVGGSLVGDPSIRIERVRAPREAGRGELAALLTPDEIAKAEHCRADAVLVGRGVESAHANRIVVDDARLAFVALLEIFAPTTGQAGVHPRASIADGARLGRDVSIGPGACVEEDVAIGDRTFIAANVFVGRASTIGAGCRIMPNVTIGERTVIGDRVTIHPGAVVGSDGFGYVRQASGEWTKIPQLGHVVIGDDVEIGANCCIDRATLEATVIGRGTKVDNLVQIGHNTRVGEDCCIVAQAGIAGSVELGARSVLGGQAGVTDHVRIGEDSKIAAQAGVTRSLASGEWIGSPAMPRELGARVLAALELLPDVRERVRALEALIERLRARANENGHPEDE